MINYKKIVILLLVQFAILTYLTIRIYLEYGAILAATICVLAILAATICVLIFNSFFIASRGGQIISALEGKISVLISINEKAYYGKIGKEMLIQKVKEKRNDLQDS